MDEPELTSHSIAITVVPTDEWLAAVGVHTHDAEGGSSILHLHPHEAVVMGKMLVQFGLVMGSLNERLSDKTPEARREIMELEAKMLAPVATDSPFDPVD